MWKEENRWNNYFLKRQSKLVKNWDRRVSKAKFNNCQALINIKDT